MRQKTKRGSEVPGLSPVGKRAKDIRTLRLHCEVLTMSFSPLEWQIVLFHAGCLRVQHIANSSCGIGYSLVAGSGITGLGSSLVETVVTLPLVFTACGDGIGASENVLDVAARSDIS